MKNSTVGLIGIGNMGFGIGLNLLKNNYELLLLEGHSKENTNYLKQKGARVINSIKEMCSRTVVIILCLPSSLEVEKICLGKNGIINWIKEGSIILDCTTSFPDSTRKISDIFMNKKTSFIDAPLTRTPKEAIEGKLNCILGMKEKQDNIEKILGTFCENIFYAGKVGEANIIKLINNGLTLSISAIVAETISKAIEIGVDLNKLREIISQGGGNSPQFQGIMQWLIEGDKNALKFSLKNAKKDLSYLKKIAGKNQKNTIPILNTVYGKYIEAIKNFGEDATLPKLSGYNAGILPK